jgi:hypothetical protein
MVAVEYSRNVVLRFTAKVSAGLLIFVGFFALLFTTTPKPLGTLYTSSGDSTVLGGGINVAQADAPACSCTGGDSGGDSGGGPGDSGGDSCCGCGGCGCDGGDCGDSY